MLSMISFWTSIWSRLIDSLKRMTAVLVWDENSSGWVETCFTSACRVTAQYPSSWKPEMPAGCAHHQTGAVCRIWANSGCGTRAWSRSGSVKSNPAGRWGQSFGSFNVNSRVSRRGPAAVPRAPISDDPSELTES